MLMLTTNTDMPGPALLSSTTNFSTATGSATTSPPSSAKPDYSAFSAFGSSQPASTSSTPKPSFLQQQQAVAMVKPSTPSVDPFASLASPIRHSTPQQTSSMFDFASHAPPAAVPAAALPAADDDDWAFSSALPEGLPASNTITVSNTHVNITLHAKRQPQTPDIITMTVRFTSKAQQPVSDLTFEVAVTKVMLETFHL